MPHKLITVCECTCVACGYAWQSRLLDELPVRCPGCGTRRWDAGGPAEAGEAIKAALELKPVYRAVGVKKACPRHRDVEWAACQRQACKMDYADYLTRQSA